MSTLFQELCPNFKIRVGICKLLTPMLKSNLLTRLTPQLCLAIMKTLLTQWLLRYGVRSLCISNKRPPIKSSPLHCVCQLFDSFEYWFLSSCLPIANFQVGNSHEIRRQKYWATTNWRLQKCKKYLCLPIWMSFCAANKENLLGNS